MSSCCNDLRPRQSHDFTPSNFLFAGPANRSLDVIIRTIRIEAAADNVRGHLLFRRHAPSQTESSCPRTRASGRCLDLARNRDAPAATGSPPEICRAVEPGHHPGARACRRGRRPTTAIERGIVITSCARAHGTLGHHGMKKPTSRSRRARALRHQGCVRVLLDIMRHPNATHASRLSAALALRDPGWGKPTQPDKCGKADERPVSDLAVDELLARAKAIVAPSS